MYKSSSKYTWVKRGLVSHPGAVVAMETSYMVYFWLESNTFKEEAKLMHNVIIKTERRGLLFQKTPLH